MSLLDRCDEYEMRDRHDPYAPVFGTREVRAELDAARARVAELEDAVHLLLEAVDFGHMVTPDHRLYRELRALVPAQDAD